MSAPLVSVMLVQWGKTHLTERAVASIRRSDYRGSIEVLVYDNASPGGPGPVAARDDVTLVQGDENIGFGPAHNLLAHRAGGELLVILNNDTVVDPRCLSRLVTRYRSADDIAVVAPHYRDFDGRTLEMGGYLGDNGDGWQLFRGMDPPEAMSRIAYPCAYGSAACLLVGKDDFLRMGGFDDRYAPAYYEDTDLCMALAAEGRRIVVEPTAIVFHYEGATAGKDVAAGLKSYQVRNRERFLERWGPRLAELPPIDFGAAVSHALAPAPGGLRVLWVSPHLPRPDREAGHARMVKMIQSLVDRGDRVALWAEHANDWGRYGWMLEAMGVPWFGFPAARRWATPAVASRPLQSLQDLLDHVPWDAVVISFPELAARMIPLIRKHRPAAAVLVDNLDLHFLRQERAEAAGIDAPRVLSKERELGAYRASDGVITASDLETDILREEIPGLPLKTYTVAAEEPRDAGEEIPGDLLFLGNFGHHPNVDAVEWWNDELGKVVEQRHGHALPLRVIGSGSEAYADEWRAASGERIDIGGWVRHLGPEFDRARVFLVPLRYGAGTKGKILMALAHGVPVVTTSIGAEGNEPLVADGLVVADEPEDIASAVVELMTDDDAWRERRAGAMTAAHRIWRRQQVIDAELVAWVHRRAVFRP